MRRTVIGLAVSAVIAAGVFVGAALYGTTSPQVIDTVTVTATDGP